MDRDSNGMAVLSRLDAIALLRTQEVGRLVYTRRALPAIVPVNYAVGDGEILIWTGSLSSLAQAVRGAVVAFEVDNLDRATHAGWSVVVTSHAEVVTDEAALARARRDGPQPWAPGSKDHLIRIPLTVITGRLLEGRPASETADRTPAAVVLDRAAVPGATPTA